jgi:hypothetical protein
MIFSDLTKLQSIRRNRNIVSIKTTQTNFEVLPSLGDSPKNSENESPEKNIEKPILKRKQNSREVSKNDLALLIRGSSKTEIFMDNDSPTTKVA